MPLRWERCGGVFLWPLHYYVLGGHDIDGQPLYVGRAEQNKDKIPGKINLAYGACLVGYNGKEHKHKYFEALLCRPGESFVWRETSYDNIPPGAIQGGETSRGEPLYISRVLHQGSMVIGKVHPSHQCAYISFAGYEHKYHEYEILCDNSLPGQ